MILKEFEEKLVKLYDKEARLKRNILECLKIGDLQTLANLQRELKDVVTAADHFTQAYINAIKEIMQEKINLSIELNKLKQLKKEKIIPLQIKQLEKKIEELDKLMMEKIIQL